MRAIKQGIRLQRLQPHRHSGRPPENTNNERIAQFEATLGGGEREPPRLEGPPRPAPPPRASARVFGWGFFFENGVSCRMSSGPA